MYRDKFVKKEFFNFTVPFVKNKTLRLMLTIINYTFKNDAHRLQFTYALENKNGQWLDWKHIILLKYKVTPR
jgi:hypothetical protein